MSIELKPTDTKLKKYVLTYSLAVQIFSYYLFYVLND